MKPRAVVLALSALLGAIGAFMPTHAAQQPAADTQERTRLLALQRGAATALQQAARVGAPADQVRRALLDASRSIDALSAGPDPGTAPATTPARMRLDPSLQGELRRAASTLRTLASGDVRDVASATGPVLALLERARAQLEGDVALGLPFQGSYSQTKPKEPAYGGHASAMGPAPANLPSPGDGAPVPVTFEVGAQLPTKMYCGGPTKDHILESACGGVALFDYDGDGLLDIYLVTGGGAHADASARPASKRPLSQPRGMEVRGRIQTRRASMLAAWGNGVCAGDFDGDGRLDLYVTNWGPNALFRNRGDGTFEEVAARAGVAAGGWSTGCAFFDADGDGDLDLYVARYVETTWDSVVRAQRTLELAQRATHHGRPRRPSRSSPICSSRTSATDDSWRRPTPARPADAPGPTASESSRPTTTTTGSSMCSSPTTRTRISCITTSGTAALKMSDWPRAWR